MYQIPSVLNKPSTHCIWPSRRVGNVRILWVKRYLVTREGNSLLNLLSSPCHILTHRSIALRSCLLSFLGLPDLEAFSIDSRSMALSRKFLTIDQVRLEICEIIVIIYWIWKRARTITEEGMVVEVWGLKPTICPRRAISHRGTIYTA